MRLTVLIATGMLATSAAFQAPAQDFGPERAALKLVEWKAEETALHKTAIPAGSEWRFAAPLSASGTMKTIQVEFGFTGKAVSLSPIIVNRWGIEYRLYAVSCQKGTATWALSPATRFSRGLGADTIAIAGFRLHGDRAASLSIRTLSSVVDPSMAEQDADNIRHETWKDGKPGATLASAKLPAVEPPARTMPELPAAGAPQDWDALAALAGTELARPDRPGFPIYRNALVAALWKADPTRTLSALQAQGEGLWVWMSPGALFDIIGWERSPLFDNVWGAILDGRSILDRSGTEGADLFYCAAALYASTGNQRLLEILRFGELPEIPPGKFLKLWQFFTERGCPTDGLVEHLRKRGRLTPYAALKWRSPSLEERLAQALLVRTGNLKALSPDGVDTAWTLGPAGKGLEGLELDRALAALWAGTATADDRAVIARIEALPQGVAGNRYRSLLAALPENRKASNPLSASALAELANASERHPAGPDWEWESGTWYSIPPIATGRLVGTELTPTATGFSVQASGVDLPWVIAVVCRSSLGNEREFIVGGGSFEGTKELRYRFPEGTVVSGEKLTVAAVRLYCPRGNLPPEYEGTRFPMPVKAISITGNSGESR